MIRQSWLPSLPAPESWMEDAACRNLDPDLFFIESSSAEQLRKEAEAKAACRTCPVAAECLAFSIRHDERYGVWGGMNAADRRAGKRGRA
jgi:WhiB family redox-sensing transcriptional regulator